MQVQNVHILTKVSLTSSKLSLFLIFMLENDGPSLKGVLRFLALVDLFTVHAMHPPVEHLLSCWWFRQAISQEQLDQFV